MNFDRNQIHAEQDCVEIAQRLGLNIRPQSNGRGYRGVSITAGSHTSDDAFYVERGFWFDHSAKIGGDVIELVSQVRFGAPAKGKNFIEALKWLGYTPDDSVKKYIKAHDRIADTVAKAHANMAGDEKVLEYLHSRRITDETIDKYHIGVYHDTTLDEPRLLVAYLDRYSREPIYYATRRLDWQCHENSPKYKKCFTDEGLIKNPLFGLDTLPLKDSECNTLVLTEGVFDELSTCQEGYSALSSIGGTFSAGNIAEIVKQAQRFRRVVTCFDIDGNGSGQSFTCGLGREFLKAGVNFDVVIDYGTGHKDVSDYYTAGGDLAELFENHVMNGYVYMAGVNFWEKTGAGVIDVQPFDKLSANDKAKQLCEVKNLIRRLKDFLPEATFKDVVTVLSSRYPKEAIKKFQQPPSQAEILNEQTNKFLEGRNIFYHGSVKGGNYYEYQQAGYWVQQNDADIENEISEFFQHELLPKQVRLIAQKVRQMLTRAVMPNFNSRPVWLFKNGLLELDSGVFREARPEDFVTWQSGYNYTPNADCVTFKKCLNEWCCNDTSRLNTLRDMMGYLLFNNNRLHKMFFLLGDGANGKSVFLKMLEKLLENTNERACMKSVSNVPPANFDSPTSLIQLRYSMANISADISPDLRGCESQLKTLSAGDSITGNLKFCDEVEFVSRAKLIFSSNSMIRVNDASKGMRRRFAFIRFANDFTGRADTSLDEKLEAELSGIFNFMFECYKELVARVAEAGHEAIRPCVDQSEFDREFAETVNSVVAFWHERKEGYIGHEIEKAQVFNDFKNFCERNQKFAGTEAVFHKRLKQLCDDESVTITETRHRRNNAQPAFYTFTATATEQATEVSNEVTNETPNEAQNEEKELPGLELLRKLEKYAS